MEAIVCHRLNTLLMGHTMLQTYIPFLQNFDAPYFSGHLKYILNPTKVRLLLPDKGRENRSHL